MEFQHQASLATSHVKPSRRNPYLSDPLLAFLFGCAAAFMMYPILEDYPLVITAVLTAILFSLTGFVTARITQRGTWYFGILINAPLWLLVGSWSLRPDNVIWAALVTALVTAYGGMMAAPKSFRTVKNAGTRGGHE